MINQLGEIKMHLFLLMDSKAMCRSSSYLALVTSPVKNGAIPLFEPKARL